jgi:hypothetical protein
MNGRGIELRRHVENLVRTRPIFSTVGLEDLNAEGIKRFVEQEGLVPFRKTDPSHCAASAFIDDGGNQLWSVNIVVGDEDRTYIAVPIFLYSKVGEPNTMFNCCD